MSSSRPSPPAANLASAGGSLAGLLQFALTKYAQNSHDMLPAKVLSYNRATNRAKLQPLIPVVTSSNEVVQRAIIASVPVFQLGGGGIVVSPSLAAGDLGWIKANDRDISLFKQLLGSASPPTQRTHSFEDAMFFPDTMFKNVVIAGEDANNFVIQNLAGTVKISWWANLLKIIAPNVGIGGTPHTSALLDLQSTTKAFKFPVMTIAQRNAIPSPQMGFAVYVSDLPTPHLSTYNGTIWS